MLEKFVKRTIRESVSMIVMSMKILLDLGQTPADIASFILGEFIVEVEQEIGENIQEAEEQSDEDN